MLTIRPHTGEVVPEILCPECGDAVKIWVDAWNEETGEPLDQGIRIACRRDMAAPRPPFHHYLSSLWDEVSAGATRWARRCLRVEEETS